MMKLVTLVSLVGVWEMAGYLFIATCGMSYSVAAAAPSLRKRVDLVHRDGPLAKRPAEMKAAMVEILMRENDRIAFIQAKLNVGGNDQLQSNTQSPLYPGQTIASGNYIINIGLGSPPQELSMAIDTGSDLAWTQCTPCIACYNQTHPMFDPSASSSYQQVACGSSECSQLGSASTGGCSDDNCQYQIMYADGSTTTGDFALDTLSIGGNAVSTAYPFGCGHQNQGLFNGLDGLLGFSRDPVAFPAQTEATLGQNFAYCLPPIFSSSPGYIEFGTMAGAGSLSSPLVDSSSFYIVALNSIQVKGSSTISEPLTTTDFIIDSGTIITRLDTPLYNEVRDSFRMATPPSVSQSPPPPGLEIFDTCYSLSDTSNAIIDQTFPSITFTLTGGDFTPPAHNLVIPVDNIGTVCLALLPSDSSSGFSILGSYQQQGRLFSYDIASSTLSISSDAC